MHNQKAKIFLFEIQHAGVVEIIMLRFLVGRRSVSFVFV